MLGNFVQATHIAAGLMFILALAGLRRRETARRSTAFGILGMVFALVATGVAIAHDGLAAGSALWDSAALLCAAVLTGAVIGTWKGRRAEMAAVPGLAALFQSLSGATAMLVSLNAHLVPAQSGALYSAEVVLGLSTGALVLGGSLVAWARQDDRIAVRVLTPPGGVWTGLAVAAVVVGLGWWYVVTPSLIPLLLLVLSSLALGYHLAAVPRGADVPVAVAALGSCSGWAVVLAGLLLDQSVLVIAGALAGVFGAVLAYDMCRSMSRPPGAALLDAFKNTSVSNSGVGEDTPGGESRGRGHDARRRPVGADRARPRYGRGAGPAPNRRYRVAAVGAWYQGQIRDPSGGRPVPRASECAPGRGWGAL